MEIKGEWKVATAGGGIDGPNWRNNPQYSLSDLQNGKEVTITLKLEKKPTSPMKESIGFAVFKHSTGQQVMDMRSNGDLLLVHNATSKKTSSDVAYVLSVVAEECPFVVIPYWYPKKPAKFILSVSAGSLSLIKTETTHKTIKGAWDDNSGGSSGSSTFSNNLNILLTLKESSSVTAVLSREATVARYKGKIGFYIISVNDAPKTKFDTVPEKSLVYTPRFSSDREVVVPLKLKAGTYVVIPTTHEPGHPSLYTFICYTTQAVSLSAPLDPAFEPVKRAPSENHRSIRSPRHESMKSHKSKVSRTKSVGRVTSKEVKSNHRDAVDKGRSLRVQELEAEIIQLKDTHSKEIDNYESKIADYESKIKKSEERFQVQIKTELERYEIEKKELLDKLKLATSKAEEDFKRINELIDQVNDVKHRKNEREKALFGQIEELENQVAKFTKEAQEEEDNVDWMQPISFQKQTGNFIEIRGQWKGKSAGGSLNHFSWRNNPQIFLYVSKHSTITFTLFQPKSDNQLATNFYVFKTFTDQSKRLVKSYVESDIVCEAYFSNLKPTKCSKEGMLPQSPNPYVIVPATFLPDSESHWVLHIKSDNPVSARLSTNEDDWPCVEGNWTNQTAGGCTNFPSFTQNPMYHFKVEKQTEVTLHLLQSNPQFDSLGIYILRGEPEQKQKVFQYAPSQEVGHSDFRSPNESTLRISLQPGSYVVIPCTFNPQKIGTFQLRILSPSPVGTFTPLRDVEYVSAQGTWKGSKAGGSINDPDSWVKNAQYLLQVKRNINLTILLDQVVVNGKAFGIGWTIYRAGAKVLDPNAGNLASKSPYKPIKKLTETVEFQPGSYVVVPTTFDSGEQTDFTLSFTSQSSVKDAISLQELR